MPNWCYTPYAVSGDKNEVDDLYAKMMSLENRKESLVQNGFGKTWLGNLVTLLGGDWETVYCRGEWYNLQHSGNHIFFTTMSAWGDPDETMRFLQTKYPTLVYYFQAEETGMAYYATNDVDGIHFPERYYFDGPDYSEPACYAENELEDFLHDVGNFLGREIRSVEEAQRAINEYNEQQENVDDFAEIKIYQLIS